MARLFEVLEGRWLEVYSHFGLTFEGKERNGWLAVKSPWREDHEPSATVSVKSGWVIDRGTDEKLSPVDTITRVTGRDPKEVIREIQSAFGLKPGAPPANDKRFLIQRIVDECIPAAGDSCVTDYMRNRLMGVEPHLPMALYHPSMRSNDGDGKFEGDFPAMVHLFRLGKEIRGIHVVYLEDGDEGWGKCSKVKSAKKTMSFGLSLNGASILLESHPGGTLNICEGIETGYAVAHMTDHKESVIAAGSATLVGAIELPDKFIASGRPVQIWADSDVNGVGLSAAMRLASRLGTRKVPFSVWCDGCAISFTGRDALDVFVKQRKEQQQL